MYAVFEEQCEGEARWKEALLEWRLDGNPLIYTYEQLKMKVNEMCNAFELCGFKKSIYHSYFDVFDVYMF